MFKVSEIAEKTGKSKTSVYNRISKLKVELKPYKKTLNGVIYYDKEGFEIIKNSYIDVSRSFKGHNKPTNNIESDLLERLLLDKDEQIKHLKEQLKEKDRSLEQAMKLVENNQVLLLQKEDKILKLESYSEKKSFWDKFKSDKGGK